MDIKTGIETVLGHLAELEQHYSALLSLAREKRDVVVKNDTVRLTEITEQESILLSQAKLAERRRVIAVTEVAPLLGKSAEEITLSELAENADSPAREKLLELKAALGDAMQQLKLQNDENRGLVEAQLTYTEMMLNVIGGSSDPLNNFYGVDGKSAEAEITRGTSLFDTEI